MASWRHYNPDFRFACCNDEVCDRFIERWFGGDLLGLFRSLPVGVMKADLWRVAVIYIYGGVYSDIDVECMGPVHRWVSCGDSLVAAVENSTGSIGNFVFAARPRHPALGLALAKMLACCQSDSFLNPHSPTPVQDFGAAAFSEAIIEYYGVSSGGPRDSFFGGMVYQGRDRDEVARIFDYDEGVLSPIMSSSTLAHHKTASVFWKDGYHSWRSDQQRLFGIFGG